MDSVMTAPTNPNTGAGDHDDTCARYKYAIFINVSMTFSNAELRC